MTEAVAKKATKKTFHFPTTPEQEAGATKGKSKPVKAAATEAAVPAESGSGSGSEAAGEEP